MKLNIVEFAKKFNLDYQPIQLIITPHKTRKNRMEKKPDMRITKALDDDFRNGISQEELEKRRKIKASHIAIHSNKDLCVIDVDFKDEVIYDEESLEWVKSLKQILPYKKSNTLKRGYHFYFRNKNQTFPKNRNAHTPYKDIEILAGQWCWESVESNIKNVQDDIPFFEIPKIKNNENIKMDIKKENVKKENDDLDPLIVQLILAQPQEKVEKYEEWFNTLVWIKNTFGEKYKDIALELSNKATEDQRGGFEKTWNSIKIKSQQPNLLDSIVNPAEDLYNLFGSSVVVNSFDGKTEIYCFCDKSNIWSRDDQLLRIKTKMRKILKTKYVNDISNENNEEVKKQKLKIICHGLNSNSWKTETAKDFIGYVLENQIENVIFDNIDYLYHFKNKTLDLRDLTFRPRRKEDYCTMFGCDLKDKTDSNIWDEIISSTFLDEDVKNTYLDIMACSFSGVVLQKFIIFNGGGSNGKSFLDNCFKWIHNDYYYKGNCSDLCQSHKGGSNPSLANCNKKRFCLYTEPDEKDRLQVSTIKDITGEETINARKNFSNDTECRMGGIKVIECNKRLPLAGDTGFSLQRRLVDLLFSSTFKTEDGITEFDSAYDKEENPKGYQLANLEYDTKEWKDNNCSQLFWYLYDYMKYKNKSYKNLSKFVICKTVKDRTLKYIYDSNDFYAMICNYIEPAQNEYIMLKDIKDAIEMDHEFYNNLSKYQKRELSLPKLVKKMEEDAQFKEHFRTRFRKTQPKIDKRNVLLNYRLKLNEEEDEEEDKMDRGVIESSSDSE